MSQESIYDQPDHLKLGTIVRNSRGEFFICLQPICDSVRLVKGTRFPFLPLIQSTDSNEFNFIVAPRGHFVFLLQPKLQIQSIVTINFVPEARSETIIAKKVKRGQLTNSFYFGQGRAKYEFCGQLRYEHALRIVTRLAGEVSRIGLSESEWQRIQK